MNGWLRMALGTALALALVISARAADPEALAAAAKQEGQIVTYGCPADWAGYGAVAEMLQKKIGLSHTDTQMPSMDEITRMAAEKDKPVADIADIGLQFGPIAQDKQVLLAFRHSKWDEIPAWAKDANGLYSATYSGAMAFLVDTKTVKNVPRSWKDLLKPEYKGMVTLQDPRAAANGQFAVIAAAFANGGSEDSLTPGINYFAQLQKSGNLNTAALPDKDTLLKGQSGVALLWDFQGLAWKKSVPGLEVLIHSDGSTFGPYATVINKYSRHPNAARLWIETVLSDEGQIAFARSGARPIRKVTLPPDVQAGLLPEAQYAVVKPIANWKNMESICKKLAERWTVEVLGK
ncbi:MAG: extracellular solute-binding protein [Candidatus Riflebacteria bacterium]|nr:extracellular solute-binding protein [Candidatus Riflebacteria bacterium]